MSDDEDVILVKRSKQLHYGSLEEQEKARLAALAAAAKEVVEDTGGKDLGDIQVSNENMDLEDEISKDEKAFLEEFERRRKLNVSTDDDEVRRSLRQLGEPVCLFRAGPAVPRVRLRDLLNYVGEDAVHEMLEARIEQDRGREGTSGNSREARLGTAKYSPPPSGKPARPKERRNKAPAKFQLATSIRAVCQNPMMQSAFLLLVLFVSGVLGTQSGLPEFQQRDATCACSCDACYNHTRLFLGFLTGECDLPNSLERNRIVSQLKKENLTILCYDDLDIPTNEARIFKYAIYSSIFLIGMAVEFIRSHFRQLMRKLGKMVMWGGLITRVQSFFSSIQSRRTRPRSGNGSAREETALVYLGTDTWDDESTPTGRSQRPLHTSSTTEPGTSAGSNTLRLRRSLDGSHVYFKEDNLEWLSPTVYKMGADVRSNISLDLLDDLLEFDKRCDPFDEPSFEIQTMFKGLFPCEPLVIELFRMALDNNKMLLRKLKSKYHPSSSASSQETLVHYVGFESSDKKLFFMIPVDDIAFIERMKKANNHLNVKEFEEFICSLLNSESIQSSSSEGSTSTGIALAVSQTLLDCICQYYRNIMIDLLYADEVFIGLMVQLLHLHIYQPIIYKVLIGIKYGIMAHRCRYALEKSLGKKHD